MGSILNVFLLCETFCLVSAFVVFDFMFGAFGCEGGSKEKLCTMGNIRLSRHYGSREGGAILVAVRLVYILQYNLSVYVHHIRSIMWLRHSKIFFFHFGTSKKRVPIRHRLMTLS